VERIENPDGAFACAFAREKKSSPPRRGRAGRRRPPPEYGGLFGAGVSVRTDRGFIAVDERFQTSLPGVYAAAT
jgi:hypothetical protein